MYLPSISWYIAVYEGILQIQKVCITSRLEPYTSCILARILNRYATSVNPWDTGHHSKRYYYIGFVHNTLCHLVAGVGRPAPAPQRLPLRPWRRLRLAARSPRGKFASQHGFVVPRTWTDNDSLACLDSCDLAFVRSPPWAGGPPHRPGGPQVIIVTRA